MNQQIQNALINALTQAVQAVVPLLNNDASDGGGPEANGQPNPAPNEEGSPGGDGPTHAASAGGVPGPPTEGAAAVRSQGTENEPGTSHRLETERSNALRTDNSGQTHTFGWSLPLGNATSSSSLISGHTLSSAEAMHNEPFTSQGTAGERFTALAHNLRPPFSFGGSLTPANVSLAVPTRGPDFLAGRPMSNVPSPLLPHGSDGYVLGAGEHEEDINSRMGFLYRSYQAEEEDRRMGLHVSGSVTPQRSALVPNGLSRSTLPTSHVMQAINNLRQMQSPAPRAGSSRTCQQPAEARLYGFNVVFLGDPEENMTPTSSRKHALEHNARLGQKPHQFDLNNSPDYLTTAVWELFRNETLGIYDAVIDQPGFRFSFGVRVGSGRGPITWFQTQQTTWKLKNRKPRVEVMFVKPNMVLYSLEHQGSDDEDFIDTRDDDPSLDAYHRHRVTARGSQSSRRSRSRATVSSSLTARQGPPVTPAAATSNGYPGYNTNGTRASSSRPALQGPSVAASATSTSSAGHSTNSSSTSSPLPVCQGPYVAVAAQVTAASTNNVTASSSLSAGQVQFVTAAATRTAMTGYNTNGSSTSSSFSLPVSVLENLPNIPRLREYVYRMNNTVQHISVPQLNANADMTGQLSRFLSEIDPDRKIRVQIQGADTIDIGGPSRAYAWKTMCAVRGMKFNNIPLFDGPPGKAFISADRGLLRDGVMKMLGRFMMFAVMNVGHGMFGIHPKMIKYILSSWSPTPDELTVEDIPDEEAKQIATMLEQVALSGETSWTREETENVRSFLLHADWGYEITPSNAAAALGHVKLFFTFERRTASLEDLKAAVQATFAGKWLMKHEEKWTEVFPEAFPKEPTVLEIMEVIDGLETEPVVAAFLYDFLEQYAADDGKLSDFIEAITGSALLNGERIQVVVGSERRGTFTASVCSKQIRLFRTETYEHFKECMDEFLASFLQQGFTAY